jgi:hypothetical protein
MRPGGVDLHQFETVFWSDTTVIVDREFRLDPQTSLTIGPGTTVRFRNGYRLEQYHYAPFHIRGEEGRPVRLIVEDDNEGFPVKGYSIRWLELDNILRIEDESWGYVELEIPGGEIEVPALLDHVTIKSTNDLTLRLINGNFPLIEHSVFEGSFVLIPEGGEGFVRLDRNVINGRLSILPNANVTHCVFAAREEDDRRTALFINGSGSVRNSFFLGSYRTALNGNGDEVDVSYCGTWNTITDNPYGPYINEGDGLFREDPRFINAENGDFHLRPNSPLIDAGDPNAPRDPDGSIADVGVFPFDITPVEDSQIDLAELPGRFEVSGPYPNPFNGTTKIHVENAVGGNLEVEVYDLLGRMVNSLSNSEINGIDNSGSANISLDFSRFTTGVYFIRVVSSDNSRLIKAVLIK